MTEHTIDTSDNPPVRVTYNRSSKSENDIIKNEIDTMLKNNIIRPSRSEWCAPVVLTRKKDGTVRFCVDYRKLNNVTYPIPKIEETLQSLDKMKYFTTLDFTSGYWQINIAEKINIKRLSIQFMVAMSLIECHLVSVTLLSHSKDTWILY